MQDDPKISVITPCLNSELTIERAIQSIVEQDYDNYEHIICDGMSTDKTLDIIRMYPHVRLSSMADSGQSEAMNRGYSLSTGEVIVYLNADDYFYKDAFRAVAKEFKNGAKFVVGKADNVRENGVRCTLDPSTDLKHMLKYWVPDAFPYNPVQYFYRREIQETIPFREDNHYSMDLEFLLAARRLTEFVKITNVLGVYNSLSGTKTVEAQKTPAYYWSPDHLGYIDQYLLAMDKEYIIEYKNEQCEFTLSQLQPRISKTRKIIDYISNFLPFKI